MKRNLHLHIVIFAIAMLIINTSCREGIIEPEEFATNINEPVQSKVWNSYTFLLNAQELSVEVSNNPQISSFTTRISITILDHSSGYIRINVFDANSDSQFEYFGNGDENLFSEALNGFIPRQIGFKTYNFTGKVKVQLSRTL
ncbi:MAG: hypothetical protein PVF17_09450 [Ignavibacteria bacterium]|jgi:hypothetical protein